MLDILGGVAHLHVAQRALQPVGTGFALGQLDGQQRLHQARIAHGEAQIQVAGGQLGVEQRLRQGAGQALEDFQVLAAGMQHLDHARVVQQRGERRPVADAQRIDQHGLPTIADLHQTGDRIEGVDPHELGVQHHERLRAPGGTLLRQLGVVTDPVNVDAHAGLPVE